MLYLECKSSLCVNVLEDIMNSMNLDTSLYCWSIFPYGIKGRKSKLVLYTERDGLFTEVKKYIESIKYLVINEGGNLKMVVSKVGTDVPKKLTWLDVVSELAKYDRDKLVQVNFSTSINPTSNFTVDNGLELICKSDNEESSITVGELMLSLLRLDSSKKALAFTGSRSNNISSVKLIGDKVVILNGWDNGVPLYWE